MTTQEAPGMSPAKSPTQGGRVLIVEDDPVLRSVLVKILQNWGFAILQANDGLAALEAIDANADDLSVILLDIMLPLLNGLEVARRVRDERPEIPIVVCSAALTDDLMADLHDLGVRDFLSKPFSANDLRAILLHATRPIDDPDSP